MRSSALFFYLILKKKKKKNSEVIFRAKYVLCYTGYSSFSMMHISALSDLTLLKTETMKGGPLSLSYYLHYPLFSL